MDVDHWKMGKFNFVIFKFLISMRTHRIHLPTLQAGTVTLTGSEAHHLSKVLRVGVGQAIKAFDGRGLEADGIIQSVDDFQVALALQEPKASEVEASLKITLCIALLKGDKLSDVIRQATELGVVAVQPFISKHCDVKELSANKLERLRRVAQEASKQSGRSVVPDIHEAIKIKDLRHSQPILIAHPYATLSISDVLKQSDTNISQTTAPFPKWERLGEGVVTLVTGPEGGFANEELELLEQQGAIPVRLGIRILRAETAPIALIAALLLPDAL
jgi:16S rRNA (uracil1498-N3)-methyltransferase